MDMGLRKSEQISYWSTIGFTADVKNKSSFFELFHLSHSGEKEFRSLNEIAGKRWGPPDQVWAKTSLSKRSFKLGMVEMIINNQMKKMVD